MSTVMYGGMQMKKKADTKLAAWKLLIHSERTVTSILLTSKYGTKDTIISKIV
jgi:hypothetical protein